jgi:hypothetical protein
MPTKKRIIFLRRGTLYTNPKDILDVLQCHWGRQALPTGLTKFAACLEYVKTSNLPNGNESLLLVLRDKPHFNKNRRVFIKTLEKFEAVFHKKTIWPKKKAATDSSTTWNIRSTTADSTVAHPPSPPPPWTRVQYVDVIPHVLAMERGVLYVENSYRDIYAYGLYTLDNLTPHTGGPAYVPNTNPEPQP